MDRQVDTDRRMNAANSFICFLGNQANVETKPFINTAQICMCQQINTYFWVGVSKTFTVKLNSAQAGIDLWWIWWQQIHDLSQEAEGSVVPRYAAVSPSQIQGYIRWATNSCGFPWVSSLGFPISISAVATDNCHRYMPVLPAQPVDIEGTEGSLDNSLIVLQCGNAASCTRSTCSLCHTRYTSRVQVLCPGAGSWPVWGHRLTWTPRQRWLHHQSWKSTPKSKLRHRHVAPWKVYPTV